jgi:flagellar hook-associated protein 1 FlgK
MSGLFGILDVANRGLVVSQLGVRNTSNNIANVNTPGYSRQRQIVTSTAPTPTSAGNLGAGAEQISVERVHDSFVQAQLIAQNAAYGSTDAQASALSAVEEVVNEQHGAGIGAALARLYSAFSELAAAQTPGAPVERDAVRATAQTLIDTLHSADARLRDQMSAAQQSIDATIGEINAITTRVAELNREISAAETTAPANELRDERDMLVRSLAEKIDIHTFEDGAAQVILLPSGQPLVEGNVSHSLVPFADTANAFNPSFSRIGHQMGSSVVDITNDIGGGRLGGLLRARDTVLPSAIRSLDTIAYNVASTVNAVHSTGVGLNGAVGDFFASLPGVEDAARDLRLDPAIVANVDSIAAGTSTAAGDNTNALALAALRDSATAISLPGDPPGPASGPVRTLLDHTAGIVADIGQQTAVMKRAREQDAQIAAMLENRREEVSGVSIDEEVTELVQLQAAFRANARIMQAVDRLLEDVLSLV